MELEIHPKALEWIEKKKITALIIHTISSGSCCGGAIELVAQEGRPESLKNIQTIEQDGLQLFIPQTIYDKAERLSLHKRGFSIFTDLVVHGYNPLR